MGGERLNKLTSEASVFTFIANTAPPQKLESKYAPSSSSSSSASALKAQVYSSYVLTTTTDSRYNAVRACGAGNGLTNDDSPARRYAAREKRRWKAAKRMDRTNDVAANFARTANVHSVTRPGRVNETTGRAEFVTAAVGFEEMAAASVGGNGIGRPFGPFVAARNGNGLAVWTRVPKPRRFTGVDAIAGTAPAPPKVSRGLDQTFTGDAMDPDGGRNVSLFNILAGRQGARDVRLHSRQIASKFNALGVDAVRTSPLPPEEPLPPPKTAHSILRPPPVMARPHQPGTAPTSSEVSATFLTEIPKSLMSVLPQGLRIGVGEGLGRAHLSDRADGDDEWGATMRKSVSAPGGSSSSSSSSDIPDSISMLMSSEFAPRSLTVRLPSENILPRPPMPTRSTGLKPLFSHGQSVS